MGKHVHRIVSRDDESRTGVCANCGPVNLRLKGTRLLCPISQSRWGTGYSARERYRRFKGDACERCLFVPQHTCQLDVHHLDGDHSNNDPANLETLCANCHRLEHVPN